MSFTIETANQNRAIAARLKVLMVGRSIETSAKDHEDIFEIIKTEFPGVNDNRIWPKIAQQLREMRGRAKSLK